MEPGTRAVAVLMYWHGMGRAEIGRTLGICEGTVLRRMEKARVDANLRRGISAPTELGRKSSALKLEGFRSGSLVAVSPVGRDRHKEVLWSCRCDCGNFTTRAAGKIKSRHVRFCSRLCPACAAKSASHVATREL